MFELSQRSQDELFGVDPRLALVFQTAIRYTPIDFGIAPDGGVRTAARQNEMFLNPKIKTLCDGYEKISAHQVKPGKMYGEAVDIICWINHALTWDYAHFHIVGGVIMGTAEMLRQSGDIDIKLRWGATFGSNKFKGWDSGHFEIDYG